MSHWNGRLQTAIGRTNDRAACPAPSFLQPAASSLQPDRPVRPEARHPELDLGDGRVLVLDGDRGPTDDLPVFRVN